MSIQVWEGDGINHKKIRPKRVARRFGVTVKRLSDPAPRWSSLSGRGVYLYSLDSAATLYYWTQAALLLSAAVEEFKETGALVTLVELMSDGSFRNVIP